MNRAALNVANALGAWLGGLVIAAGSGYRAPGVVWPRSRAAGVLVPGAGQPSPRKRHGCGR